MMSPSLTCKKSSKFFKIFSSRNLIKGDCNPSGILLILLHLIYANPFAPNFDT